MWHTSDYKLVNTANTCDFITTNSECEAAAQHLGLSDTSAEDGKNEPRPYNDPPYCYFEGGSLKFNSDATNTGACSGYDKCLCKSPPTTSSPTPGQLKFLTNLMFETGCFASLCHGFSPQLQCAQKKEFHAYSPSYTREPNIIVAQHSTTITKHGALLLMMRMASTSPIIGETAFLAHIKVNGNILQLKFVQNLRIWLSIF